MPCTDALLSIIIFSLSVNIFRKRNWNSQYFGGMITQKNTGILAVSILVMLVCMGFAGAASVEPVTVDGNPACGESKHIGFKVESSDFEIPTVTGTYYLDSARYVTIETYCVNPVLEIIDCEPEDITPEDGIDNPVYDPNAFDWISNFPVDAVIVKGGPNANIYSYDPSSTGDTFLIPPINYYTEKPYGLSHVDFCYSFSAPEFPSWFISCSGIAMLLGLVIAFRRK